MREGRVAVVTVVVFDVDGVGWIGVSSAAATSSFAALDLVFVLGAGAGVSGSTALVALESFSKPGTLSITDPPLTGVEVAAFVIEAETAPVPGSFSVILEVPVDTVYSGRE